MKTLFLWLLLAFVIFVGILWQGYPLSDGKPRLTALPLEGAHFSGKEIPLSPFEKKFFSSIDLIKRRLVIDGQPFQLFVLDGTHNRHLVHDPFFCFKGAGWEILEDHLTPIPGGSATWLKISKGDETKEALFWFSDGHTRFGEAWKYWLITTWRRMTLGYFNEEPLLIILIAPTSSPDWHTILQHIPPITSL